MSTKREDLSSILLSRLRDGITRSECKVTEAEKDAKLLEARKAGLNKARKEVEICNATILYLKELRKNLQTYVADKKEKGIIGIVAGIYSAKSIIPSAGAISPSISPQAFTLVDANGCNINLIEGSALRAIISFFTRDVILKRSKYMGDMVLDEPLSTASPESSAEFSPYLQPLARDQLIILIEQKAEVFANADSWTYEFKKDGAITTVRRVS